MGNIVTRADMVTYVTRTLAEYIGEFDIEAIVDELQAEYGTVDLETVATEDAEAGTDRFWVIVERHDLTARPDAA